MEIIQPKYKKGEELECSNYRAITQYKSLIRAIVPYGCEAWMLTNRDEQYLRIFERRILRNIFGPI